MIVINDDEDDDDYASETVALHDDYIDHNVVG